MVVEQFLEKKSIKQHSLFLFLLGFSYVILGYIVAAYFFQEALSIALMFTVTLLLLPSLYVIINLEEKVESKEGMHNFYHNHKDIFKIVLFVFLGIFFAYLFLGFTTDFDSTFSYQSEFLKSRDSLSSQMISDFKVSGYSPQPGHVLSVVSSNLNVILIAFILSVFYGAGAIFLISFNASVFAAFIIFVMNNVNRAFSALGVFMIHMIPELAGFTLAAISGSIISRALVSEVFGSNGFKNVLRDSLVLLMISFILICFAAILEVYVSSALMRLVV